MRGWSKKVVQSAEATHPVRHQAVDRPPVRGRRAAVLVLMSEGAGRACGAAGAFFGGWFLLFFDVLP